jgi:hypothetical protein
MVKIVIINRYGETKTLTLSSLNYDELYKKCKFRKKKDFEKRHTWKLKWNQTHIFVQLFGKVNGRAPTINKYELPPPLDKILFYGSMAIVTSSDEEGNTPVDCTTDQWQILYERLFGGFEDLEDEDTSEEEFIPPALRAQHGYSKEHNFIVNDNEVIEYNNPSESSEEEFEFSGDENAETPPLLESGYNSDLEEGAESVEGAEEEDEEEDTGDNSELEEESYASEQ